MTEEPWRRVHPLTPLVRSWQVLAAILFFVVQDSGQRWLTGGRDDGPPELGPIGSPLGLTIGGVILVLGLALLVGMGVLSWRMTRYRVTAEAFELRRGVLFRQHRVAQLDRLQAVDISQPLLARMFGLARLSFDVAGAGDSKIELAFLPDGEAQALRNRVLAGAAGVEYAGADAPEAPEYHGVEVPLPRLVASMVLSGLTIGALLYLITLGVVAVVLGSVAPLLAGGWPALLGMAGTVWTRFNRGFGFRAAVSPDGVRLRHGLTEHRTQTVPPGRVQAVELSQPLLWRRTDWWHVTVTVAGYGGMPGEQAQLASTLLPVGTRAEALTVLAYVLPDLGVGDEDPYRVMDDALTGSGAASGFVTSPRAARWFDWISWRRNGFRATERALLVRHGVVQRSVTLVPHARTQSLGVTQGPWQRRLRLASVEVHTTPGSISPRVDHLAVDVAAGLITAQTLRARAARAAAGPERWMRQA